MNRRKFILSFFISFFSSSLLIPIWISNKLEERRKRRLVQRLLKEIEPQLKECLAKPLFSEQDLVWYGDCPVKRQIDEKLVPVTQSEMVESCEKGYIYAPYMPIIKTTSVVGSPPTDPLAILKKRS